MPKKLQPVERFVFEDERARRIIHSSAFICGVTLSCPLRKVWKHECVVDAMQDGDISIKSDDLLEIGAFDKHDRNKSHSVGYIQVTEVMMSTTIGQMTDTHLKELGYRSHKEFDSQYGDINGSYEWFIRFKVVRKRNFISHLFSKLIS